MSLVYLWEEITGQQLISNRSEPSILNAVLFLAFIGIPGFTYAVKARFGLRKKVS
jgi:hypothetical protein